MAEAMEKWDVKVLGGLGAGLLALAGIFLWRDLRLDKEVLLILAATGTLVLAFFELPGAWRLAAPVAVLSLSGLGGLWYAAMRHPLLLVGLALMFAASVVALVRAPRHDVLPPDLVRHRLVWYGLTCATIAASWAFYFHFLTLGVAEDHVARRLVLTLGWLVVGVVMVLWGRQRGALFVRDAGFCFVAIAVGKALGYDTVNLDGTLRVAGLAASGLLMLGGALLTSRSTSATVRGT
ncbi:DUF2339 domain-containing protein [Myxococcus stipitatus]|uniref:DUF2339 domain-containing protein n=1 Tax=Myxococcus stipitatus TaxID=83455 RepID=UPI0031452CD4